MALVENVSKTSGFLGKYGSNDAILQYVAGAEQEDRPVLRGTKTLILALCDLFRFPPRAIDGGRTGDFIRKDWPLYSEKPGDFLMTGGTVAIRLHVP